MTSTHSGYDGTPITLRTNRQTEGSPRQRQPRAAITAVDEENPDAWEVEKSHTSAVRYDYPLVGPRRTTQLQPAYTRKVKPSRRIDRATLVILLCLAIIAMVLGWFVLSAVASWWQGVQDNFTFGTPWRTFQADQYVGLGDSPAHPDHFIALNLHGVIEVIQINPQDRLRDAVYVLANVGDDSIPASLAFRDTTGSGKIYIVVTIGDSTPYTIVLLNNGKTFQPTQPAH